MTKAQEQQIEDLSQVMLTLEEAAHQEEFDPVIASYRLKYRQQVHIDMLTKAIQHAQDTLEAHDIDKTAEHYRLMERVTSARDNLAAYVSAVTQLNNAQPAIVVRRETRILRGHRRG